MAQDRRARGLRDPAHCGSGRRGGAANRPLSDHFSPVARDYARFRPRYPEALFEWLAGKVERRELAWDCGTGNGQAALALAKHFARVIATDRSGAQLAEAAAHQRVEYRAAAAEASGLGSGSVDLVTVAQALHWFDRARFYPEVRRVLRPGGLLAVWSYGPIRVASPAAGALVGRYAELVAPWWPPERALVEAGYRTIEFPFAEIVAPAFEMSAEWTAAELCGYLGTWSATRACIEAVGGDPLRALETELIRQAGSGRRHRVEWPLALRVGWAGTEKAGPPEGRPAVSLPRSD